MSTKNNRNPIAQDFGSLNEPKHPVNR